MKVSVVIPTLNAASTIERALLSVRASSLGSQVEAIVVDSLSPDGTAALAEKHATVIRVKAGRFEARAIGAREASGEFVMNMDADQVLEPTALERAYSSGYRAVAFEEVVTGRGIVAAMDSLDKRVIGSHVAENLDPIKGSIKPRFYDRGALIRAYERVGDLGKRLTAYEDAVLYWEVSREVPTAGYVERGIYHAEDMGLIEYARKWARYGRSARALKGTKYEFFLRNRGMRIGSVRERAPLIGLVALKGFSFALGYYLGR
ncbi:glycosyltransferase family 2 protein [Tardisphaera saccharovorans]